MTDQNEAAALEAGLRAAIEAAALGKSMKAIKKAYFSALPKPPDEAEVEDKQALPAAPGGWVLVPREDEDMWMAAMVILGKYWSGPIPGKCIQEMFEAAFAAAPSAPLASTVAAPGVGITLDAAISALHRKRDSLKEQGFTLEDEYAAVKVDEAAFAISIAATFIGLDFMLAPTPVAASGPTLGSEADLPRIDSFHINPKGGANIVVEGGDRFCHESDVKDYQEAVKRLLRQAPTSAASSLVAAETGLDAVARLATWTKVSFRGVTGAEVKVRFPSAVLADVFESAIRAAARLTPPAGDTPASDGQKENDHG